MLIRIKDEYELYNSPNQYSFNNLQIKTLYYLKSFNTQYIYINIILFHERMNRLISSLLIAS